VTCGNPGPSADALLRRRATPRRLAAGLCLLASAALAGCASDLDIEKLRGTVRLIANAEPDEVLSEAEILLRREFGRVEVDRRWSQVRTVAQEYVTQSDSGTVRDWIGAPTTVRRTATFTVARRDGGTLARLRVDVERLDTRRAEIAARDDHRLTDTPGYTPIERDAATTAAQNTVWTPIGRNLTIERELLAELLARFATPNAETNPPPD
jgi:hypothetical protein